VTGMFYVCIYISVVHVCCLVRESVMCLCVLTAIALSLQEAEKKSKSQPSASLYPTMSNVGSASTSAFKNREPRKVMYQFMIVAHRVPPGYGNR